MRVRLFATVDRLRSSLFFLPTVAMVLALGLAFAGVWLDSQLDDAAQLPLVLTSTVDSARAILTTVAAATISFAGIAFSIALLVIQLTSSQYSPRVVHTLFRDPFNRRVVALVVGTFTYCIVVLRSVRGPLEQSGDAIIPNLSVAIAVLFGIGSILGIVAFINHSAHSMDVSEILEQATTETISQVHAAWRPAADGRDADPPAPIQMEPPGHLVRFTDGGWIQRVDLKAIADLVPPAGFVELHCTPGRYAVVGAALCSVSGTVEDAEDLDASLRRAIVVGPSRTMHHDPMYGLRQIVDVGVRALSPGINDPTTAQDAIFHMAAVVTEMLRHDPPPRVRSCEGGGQLLVPMPSHGDVVSMAFDELRRSAVAHPTVSVYLLQAIDLICQSLVLEGLGARVEPLEQQADLIARGTDAVEDLLAEDRAIVHQAHRQRDVTRGAT